jgi:iron complex outermembrane receptor protein
MKNNYLVLLFTLLCSVSIAQNATIAGYVTDVGNKEKLSGVVINVDGVNKVVTGLEGDYKIVVSGGEHTIKFTMLGYEVVERKVNIKGKDLINLNIKLSGKQEQLSMVVISASQYEKDLKRENVSIEVLGKDQLKNNNSTDLSDAVNRAPGVQVQDGQISIRGGSSYSYGVGSRTAVLVDNLSISSADLGMNQWSFAPLENAEQVEITKGSSSVVYGSSALNGVVNVRTAWPKADPETEITAFTGFYQNPKRAYMAWWGTGNQPGMSGLSFSHKQKYGNLDVVGGANFYMQNSYLDLGGSIRGRLDFKTQITSKKKPGLQYGIDVNWQRENNGFFFLSVDLDSNAYVASSSSDNRYMQTAIDPHLTYTNDRGSKHILRTRYLNVYRWGNGDDPNANSNGLTGDYQYQKRFKEKAVLTAGLPLNFGFSTSNLYPGLRLTYSGALYAQGEYAINKKLSVTAGLRYEINSVDTIVQLGIPVFRSGLNWQVGKATFFRASYGQSYRMPTVGERFVDADFSILKIVPNPRLDVERGWSAEFGVKQGFRIGNFKALADAAFFWQEYSKFVEYRFGYYFYKTSGGADTSSFGLKPFNVAGARIAGWELSIMGEGEIGPVKIRTLAGYTYTFPGDLDSLSDIKGAGRYIRDMFKYATKRADSAYAYQNLLQFRTRHLIRGDVELSYKKLSVGYTLYYGSWAEKIPEIFTLASFLFGYDFDRYEREHINGDWIMDGRLAYELSNKIKLSFIAKNLTNRIYATRPGIMEPPRNFTLQLRIKL